MKMPRNIGPVHFVGIGGIGMSGIAEILHNQGYVVQGSDMAANPNVQRLQGMGIRIEIGQDRPELAAVGVGNGHPRDGDETRAQKIRGGIEHRLPQKRRLKQSRKPLN